ncbi:MAG: transcriptional regulator [Clostridiales bacterium GWE2_32_10]|nr:MAG: transcriptional regulator [Clostridiales bacterium GWE2_32_10]
MRKMERLFGEYISRKRTEKGVTIKQIAEELSITPAYWSDIEKSRRNPPDIEALERISKILQLSAEERDNMLDYAGKDRDEIAPDLPEYIMNLPEARTALRKARDKGKQDDFWKSIIEKLDKEDK